MGWKFSNDKPIFAQIIDQVELMIISGQYVLGDRLLSVRDMATEAGVNPNTMQKALTELEKKGLLLTNRTNGKFITDDQELVQQIRAEKAVKYIAQLLKNMHSLGYGKKEIQEIFNKQMEELGA
ncbi:MAG: GntR family transcriptional regulator [Clostridia bacterium]